MALSAKQSSVFLLLALLSSSLHTHARDSQFFNRVPSADNNQQDPNFLPENENGYGLYGHESTTEFKQPTHKYLPKNYNPVAYVTQPDDVKDSASLTEERSYATNNGEQQEHETESRSFPTTNNRGNANYYYNGGNSQQQELSGTRYGRGNYFDNAGANGFRPQGMSDTRFLENGKYFFDINTDKYSSNHPYESLRGVRENNEYNNRNFYGNTENNAYEFNREDSTGGYQNQEELQDDESLP